MKCPKCRSTMACITVDDVDVDRCVACQGLWFGMLEDEALKASAAAVDTGDPASGAKYNAIDRISCPVCVNTPLIRMVDVRQPHIRFESCPSCYGRFFDAGEFKDLGTHSVLDRIRSAVKKARR